jgi:hypothetical protein
MVDKTEQRMIARSRALIDKFGVAQIGCVTSPFFEEMALDFRQRALAEQEAKPESTKVANDVSLAKNPASDLNN